MKYGVAIVVVVVLAIIIIVIIRAMRKRGETEQIGGYLHAVYG
jgi:hypothetical protein